MPPTVKPGFVEYLEIDGYPLANHCNWLRDLTGMWKVAYRVSTVPTPYVHGRASFPTYLDELSLVFPGLLIGEVDSDGTPIADARDGLADNYEEFYAAVLAPPGGDGTRDIEWHRADASVWTGSVQVAGFDVRAHDPAAISYSLTLGFPDGRLTAP